MRGQPRCIARLAVAARMPSLIQTGIYRHGIIRAAGAATASPSRATAYAP